MKVKLKNDWNGLPAGREIILSDDPPVNGVYVTSILRTMIHESNFTVEPVCEVGQVYRESDGKYYMRVSQDESRSADGALWLFTGHPAPINVKFELHRLCGQYVIARVTCDLVTLRTRYCTTDITLRVYDHASFFHMMRIINA